MANAFLSRLLSRPEALELRARFDGIIILDERIHARAQDLYEGACGDVYKRQVYGPAARRGGP